MRNALMATAALMGVMGAAPALAAAGAPMGAPMQPGGWGPGGWNEGAGGPPPGPMGYGDPHGYGDRGYGPHGYGRHDRDGYPRAERGMHLKGALLDPAYTVGDWHGWGLSQPAQGTRWIRYYDDAALVDAGGIVLDTRYGMGWDAPRGAYAGGYGPHPGFGPGPGYAGGVYSPAPGVTAYRAGPNTTVTTQVVGAPVVYGGGGGGYGYSYGFGGGATVVVSPSVITTTTTTTDETIYRSVGVRHWHRPIRHRIVRRPCVCGS